MTTEMIMMLLQLGTISWDVNDVLYAFPMDDTKEEDTCGHGFDVVVPYELTICASFKNTRHKLGFCTVETYVCFQQPWGNYEKVPKKWDVSLAFMRETPWDAFLARIQEFCLDRSFWKDRLDFCENFLRNHPKK